MHRATENAQPESSVALPLYYLLFTLSGFAGLIYESIWSHYLKLLLGHAAHAQTVVLTIFMGGLALGSWWAGKRSARWSRLLLGYAAVEAAIGLSALAFHPLFLAANEAFLEFAGRVDFGPRALDLAKWSLGAALIAPQSFLLGMSFPLLSAGLLRGVRHAPGRVLATLYGLNSLGATIGVLVSGLWLVGHVGLPGTIALAGLLNLALAAVVWAVNRGRAPSAAPGAVVARSTAHAPSRLLLTVAALTGLSSFVYELCWIRMLSMVLGAATHSFELMLSAFILGLALGGAWIRRRIDSLADPRRWLAALQLAMGASALVSLALYARAFDAMSWLLGALARTPAGYELFLLGSHGLALFIMLPATFCAGTTLPLITHALQRAGHGEGAIGRVYALNTLGAIVGVLVTVHLALPNLGLRGTMVSGAAVDLLLGVVLLSVGRVARGGAWGTAVASLALLALVVVAVPLDVRRMASGVYRHGTPRWSADTEVLFHADGKTATIDVLRTPGGKRVILTNGKPDAAIETLEHPPSPDEATMVLMGALPLALQPHASLVANIGFGSGLTTATLLGEPRLERVDTIEIEAQMVEGARHFMPRVEAAYADRRSRIVIDDAKTWFAAQRTRYDLILSEPSNPWVSGVASLFSTEFYAQVERYLADDGLLVQWLQLYEFDTRLLASVIAALTTRFPHYVIYQVNDSNILIVAHRQQVPRALSSRLFDSPALAAELARVGVRGVADLAALRVAGAEVLEPFFASYRAPSNSDFHPYLDQQAPRARYLQRDAAAVVALRDAPLPLLEMLEGETQASALAETGLPLLAARRRRAALASLAALDGSADGHEVGDVESLLAMSAAACPSTLSATRVRDALLTVAENTAASLTREENARLWRALARHACVRDDTLTRQWLDLHGAIGARDAVAMHQQALALLAADASRGDTRRHGLLVASAMLGALARGDARGALAAWDAHREPGWRPDTVNVHLRLLLATALFRASSSG
ncbi:MAG: spermine synthase [Gammaproteobacteria bacterium]